MSSSLRTVRGIDLARSRFGETFPTPLRTGVHEEPLVRAVSSDEASRSWRVQLGRLERNDSRPPLVRNVLPNLSQPEFFSQQFGYAAGLQNAPGSPPFRDNPVMAATGGSDTEPVFCQVAWGTSSSRINRLLAHWPVLGASIVVHGSYVEVFGGVAIFALGTLALGQLPNLNAQLTPTDGLAVTDAGELSLQQDTAANVGTTGAVVYVPDFARRVRVSLRPDTAWAQAFGQPRAVLDWWSDAPAIVDSQTQGTSIGAPPEWQPVPSQATLLQITTPGANLECNELPFASALVLVHWRIAP